MSDQNTPPTPSLQEVVESEHFNPPGRKLDTLGDVRRALASVCRRIEIGTIDHKTGHTLVMGLNCLANLHIDHRDSIHKRRLAVLWKEREAAQQGDDTVTQ
jgi:hypothetical protein